VTLLVFLVLVVICTAAGYWLVFRLGRATPIMLAVGVTTVLTCVIRKRELASLGWGWGSWRYQWLSYGLPLFIALLAYLLIWSAWHLPLFLMGIYGADGTPMYYQLFFFTLLLVSNSVTMTYLRLKTDSLWTAVVFHASANVFLQKFFTPMTQTSEHSAWYVDEFGAIPALAALAVGVYFWRKGKAEFGQAVKRL
jgi:hypothetical protein